MQNVEEMLYGYLTNVAKIAWLRDQLSSLVSVHGAQMEQNVGKGVVVSPVELVVEEKIRIEDQIRALQKRTAPIETLLRILPHDLALVLIERYFLRCPWRKIAQQKGWSRTTLWRHKKMLLRITKEHLAEYDHRGP